MAALIILMFAATVPVTAADTNAVLAESAPQQQQDPQAEATADAAAREEGPISDAPRVVIVLEKGGEIVMELMPEEAPLTVERFTLLVNDGFYNGLKFHRVESWLIQTGKKETKLEPIEGEMFYQSLKHDKAMVGMARYPDDYDSGSTQFYILKECKNALNGEYTIFACVVEGMDVVTSVKKGAKIKEIRFAE
ncbi:MAG: peptidylprolyl isomerase [Candidatus Krumholzibacteria bacterium]|nr:peptidylprolyl isomerase [Candidatus Krumholzibacteria bacterium]